ncbi:MAG TPA: aldo/keto reductase [Candidatus Bacteroides avicola]|uniref:Aldo/keto reductase n=1 Tax=Candidatus Bacteroides avicola TaxID=2838468 RepID=A0A9D2KUF7_9BACE|nr:aldo/keto reductase [Candidatus Bacteroides avicola]
MRHWRGASCLSWLLQRPTVCSLIIGASSEEQLRQNLGAVDWKLTAEQIHHFDAVSKTEKSYTTFFELYKRT